MTTVGALKSCISLQNVFDCIDNEQQWMAADLKGLKRLHKKWFMSRWNSEVISVGLTTGWVLAFLALDVVTGFAYSNELKLLSLTTVMPAIIFLHAQNIRRERIIGADVQLSTTAPHCDPLVLDAFMHVFEQKHPEIALAFMKKFTDLKANGLTPYQAHQIVRVLTREFGITEYSVLNDTLKNASAHQPIDIQAQVSVEIPHKNFPTSKTLKL